MRNMTNPCSISLLVTVTTLAIAVWSDLRRLRIPNALTFTALAVGWTLAGVTSALAAVAPHHNMTWLAPIGLVDALLGSCAGFAMMLLVYVSTGRGAGDVKLAGALGALLGPLAIVNTVIWTFVAAGSYAVVITLFVGAARFRRWDTAPAISNSNGPVGSSAGTHFLQRPIPLAGFFAVGVALTYGGI